jgi:uncharacterized protein (TIGR02444 family)
MPHTLLREVDSKSRSIVPHPCLQIPFGARSSVNESKGEFRRFAMDVYGCAGVPAAAVLLQDRRGVDVNVLLLAAFVGAAKGLSFTAREAAAARAGTDRWQDDVVVPLRTLRRRLKDGPPPAPNPATTSLREQIKTAELAAELIELDELSWFADNLDAPPAGGGAEKRATAAMEAVVHERGHRAPSQDEYHAIAVIASAAASFERDAKP